MHIIAKGVILTCSKKTLCYKWWFRFTLHNLISIWFHFNFTYSSFRSEEDWYCRFFIWLLNWDVAEFFSFLVSRYMYRKWLYIHLHSYHAYFVTSDGHEISLLAERSPPQRIAQRENLCCSHTKQEGPAIVSSLRANDNDKPRGAGMDSSPRMSQQLAGEDALAIVAPSTGVYWSCLCKFIRANTAPEEWPQLNLNS